MIDLSSLKEQLRLLGHTLPDDQIMNILKEMNIEVAAAEASATQAPQCSSQPSAGDVSASSSGQNAGSFLFSTAPTAPATTAPAMPHHLSTSASLQGPRIGSSTVASMAGPCSTSHASYLGGASTAAAAGLGVGQCNTGPAAPAALSSMHNHAPVQAPQPAAAWSGSSMAASHDVAPKQPHEWYGQLASRPTTDAEASTAAGAGVAASSNHDAAGSRTPTFLSLSSKLGAATHSSGSGLKSGARRVALYGPDSEDEEEEGEEDDDVAPLPDARHRGIPRKLGLDQQKVAWGASGAATKQGGQAASVGRRGAAAGAMPSGKGGQSNGLSTGSHAYDNDDDDETDHEVEQILARYYGAGKASTSTAPAAGVSLARPLSASSRPLMTTGAAGGTGAHMQPGRPAPLSAGGAAGQSSAYAAAAAAAAPRAYSSDGGRGQASGSGGAPANEVPHYGHHTTYTASVSGSGYTSQPGAAPRSLLHRVAGGPVPDTRPAARPPKFNWEDHLRSDQAPRPSRAPSVSGFSVTTSCASGVLGGKGAKKTDRVARYSQLQKEWSKDKFLKSADVTGAAKAGLGSKKATAASSRKPLNFHAYFKALHAAEAAERDAVIKHSRAKTAYELSQGSRYVAPSDKRRDALRLEVRQRMNTGQL